MRDIEKRGRSGCKLKKDTLKKIIDVMTDADYDGMTQKEVAEKVNISVRSLRNYLTDDVWGEIKTLRLDVMQRSLISIDKAIYSKAAEGDVSAAKLIYTRWEKEAESCRLANLKQAPRTLKEINAELKKLREEVYGLEKEYFETEDKTA